MDYLDPPSNVSHKPLNTMEDYNNMSVSNHISYDDYEDDDD